MFPVSLALEDALLPSDLTLVITFLGSGLEEMARLDALMITSQ